MDLVGLLADGDRLRVFAAIVLGSERVAEIREVTGLTTREVGKALTRLVQSGLVLEDKLGYHIDEHEIRSSARELRPADRPDELPGETAERARVRRAFFKDGRLTMMPAGRAKRQIVLDVLAQDFEPGTRFTEKQVNLIIGKRFADAATIRRYLVDEGFLEREGGGGRYWRAGGTFEP